VRMGQVSAETEVISDDEAECDRARANPWIQVGADPRWASGALPHSPPGPAARARHATTPSSSHPEPTTNCHGAKSTQSHARRRSTGGGCRTRDPPPSPPSPLPSPTVRRATPPRRPTLVGWDSTPGRFLPPPWASSPTDPPLLSSLPLPSLSLLPRPPLAQSRRINKPSIQSSAYGAPRDLKPPPFLHRYNRR
jgi:hypothetical protein